MRKTIIHARKLRKTMTDAERKLWHILRRRYLENFRFRKQAPLGPYVIDFLCHETRLIIEIDGGQHADQVEYDNQRTHWLEKQGYRVLRFWNNEVLTNLNGVAEVILRECNSRSPLPVLPPQAGEGTQ
jgi:very-short-patch-repair endonuclease